MQRSRFVMPVFMFLAVCSFVPAHSQTAPPPVFVTVAFNAAVLQTAEAQRDFAALQIKFTPRQTHLQSLNTEIEGLKRQLEDGGSRLSETEKNAKVRALDTDEKQLQREAEDFKADTDSASQQAFQAIAQKLYAFLREYSQQHAYSLVIERGSDTAPVVWYTAGNADITDLLVQAYNLRAGVAPPAKPSVPSLPSSPAPAHRRDHAQVF